MNHHIVDLLLLGFLSLSSAQTEFFPITERASHLIISLQYWGPDISQKFTKSYLIDLDGTSISGGCPRPRLEYGCTATECHTARSFLPTTCPSMISDPSDKHCSCKITALNPINGQCYLASLSSYNVTISHINGTKVDSRIYGLFVSCSSSTAMEVAGFSRAPFSLSKQISKTDIFSLCLPHTEKVKGFVFFDTIPSNLNPHRSKFDSSKILVYTPPMKHPYSPGYFIGLKGISIDGRVGNYKRHTFDLNSRGDGGVKISSVLPYTRLRSDIFETFVLEFAKALNGVPVVKKVDPFDFCVDISKLKKGILGFKVPTIGLLFDNGETWPIYGLNSMKEVGNDVACLAFVNGTNRAKHAIEIGIHQMKGQLLSFNLHDSRLGFSGPLIRYNITCGDFNFTPAA